MAFGNDATMPENAPAPLTLADFDGLVGTSFAIATEVGPQQLELVSATALPQSTRPEGGFRLEFAGPAEPRLPQAIYAFPVKDVPHDIFIVAIGVNAAGAIRYEAVFF